MFRLRCSIAGSALLLLVLPARADHFDYYTNPVLAKAIEDGVLKELKELTSDQMAEYADVLGDSSAVFLIVVTNDNRHAKLLVRPARQRVGTDQQVSMILIEKYVTYKEATERTVKAKAENVHLYGDSRLHLDLGQIVPEKMGGDLIVIESPKNPNSLIVKPLNKAKLFVVTKAIANVVPKKAPKLVLGEKFEPRFFIGTYKLCDDGRHSGQLKLEVNESGEVTGSFYSDKDGAKYEVTGQIGTVKHSITFKVKWPATEQTFTGYMFTGDGKAIAGTTKLQDRDAGFYAERADP